MLELDLLLNAFVDSRYDSLDAEQLDTFLQLLDYPDQVLHDLLVSGRPASSSAISALVDAIRQSVRER